MYTLDKMTPAQAKQHASEQAYGFEFYGWANEVMWLYQPSGKMLKSYSPTGETLEVKPMFSH